MVMMAGKKILGYQDNLANDARCTHEGRLRARIIFEGTSKSKYDTKKMDTIREYSEDVRLRSFSIPPDLAF